MGRRILKTRGGAAQEEMWTEAAAAGRTEIAAIWAGGTLDKRNGEENCSSGLRFTNNIMSQ